jgi:protein gp37
MSDLFHRDVPEVYIQDVFAVMQNASQHTFQVLTKRSERLSQMNSILKWTENIWMGVSIENADYLYRADHLRQVPAAVRFLSCEPLLGPLSNMNLDGIHWVIVGGESGPGSRPMNEKWVLDILNNCKTSRVPFFFKQWGGVNKNKAGRLLNNQVFNQIPLLTSK